jgi:hypothetical protein
LLTDQAVIAPLHPTVPKGSDILSSLSIKTRENEASGRQYRIEIKWRYILCPISEKSPALAGQKSFERLGGSVNVHFGFRVIVLIVVLVIVVVLRTESDVIEDDAEDLRADIQ